MNFKPMLSKWSVGVESWCGVLEWSVGVDSWGGFQRTCLECCFKITMKNVSFILVECWSGGMVWSAGVES